MVTELVFEKVLFNKRPLIFEMKPGISKQKSKTKSQSLMQLQLWIILI